MKNNFWVPDTVTACLDGKMTSETGMNDEHVGCGVAVRRMERTRRRRQQLLIEVITR